MSESEIIRMGFGCFYAQNTKSERQLWIDSLPEIHLSNTQIQELENNLEESLASEKMTFGSGQGFVEHLNSQIE